MNNIHNKTNKFKKSKFFYNLENNISKIIYTKYKSVYISKNT